MPTKLLPTLAALTLTLTCATTAGAEEDRLPEPTRGPNEKLLAGGGIVFATAYGASLVMAGASFAERYLVPCWECGSSRTPFGGGALAIPIAGPIVLAQLHPRDMLLNVRGGSFGATAQTLLYVDAAVQAAGAVSVALAFVVGDSREASTKTADVHVSPMHVANGAGVAVSVTRW